MHLSGIHHNIHVKSDFEHLKLAMKESHIAFPEKQFEIILAVSEEQTVAVLTKIWFNNTTYSISYFFKIQEKKIVEMWDNAIELPINIVNQKGAF